MSRLLAVLRVSARCAAILVLCVAGLSLLGSGTCVWSSDDDDSCYDDDAGNDAGCDDEFEDTAGDDYAPADAETRRQLDALPSTPTGPLGAAPPVWALGGDTAALATSFDPAVYQLDDTRVVESAQDPRRHPAARLVVTGGPSLTELWRLAVWSPVDLTVFAEQVRRANDDLLGLPPAFGELRHGGTFVLDTIVAVVFQQVAPVSGQALEGARQVLVFDGLGRLLEIENSLVVPPGQPTPDAEGWSRR